MKINNRIDENNYPFIDALAMFSSMLDSAYHGILYVDETGIVRYVNEAFAGYNKLSKEKIIGRPLGEFEFESSIETALKAEQYELLFICDIGPRKFVGARWPVYRDNKYSGIFNLYFSVSAQDVERKWGKLYLDLIAKVQAKDIMTTIAQTMLELDTYRDEFNKTNMARRGIDNIIGTTQDMLELKRRVLLVGTSPSTVLITGESGTGKELFAHAIHYHSNRADKPFVKVNCAAIPETLLESELFGYVEGAFTGARKGGKMGKFELANKGTIFLDEIGDMPLSMQAKLLRVLQEKEIERLGDDKTIPVNIRIVSATNRDLMSLVSEGKFREDLYYRLHVIVLHIPPLRERKNDIHGLINYAIKELNKNLNMSILRISPEALNIILAYDWPGNVRELKNVIEAAMNFCRSNIIEPEALPYFLFSSSETATTDRPHDIDLRGSINETEKEQLIAGLKQCEGSRKEAARILNLSKSTLYRMMKKHNLLE